MKKRKRKTDLPHRYLMAGIVLFTVLVVFALILWSVSQAKYPAPPVIACRTSTAQERLAHRLPYTCETPIP